MLHRNYIVVRLLFCPLRSLRKFNRVWNSFVTLTTLYSFQDTYKNINITTAYNILQFCFGFLFYCWISPQSHGVMNYQMIKKWWVEEHRVLQVYHFSLSPQMLNSFILNSPIKYLLYTLCYQITLLTLILLALKLYVKIPSPLNLLRSSSPDLLNHNFTHDHFSFSTPQTSIYLNIYNLSCLILFQG